MVVPWLGMREFSDPAAEISPDVPQVFWDVSSVRFPAWPLGGPLGPISSGCRRLINIGSGCPAGAGLPNQPAHPSAAIHLSLNTFFKQRLLEGTSGISQAPQRTDLGKTRAESVCGQGPG